MSSLSPHKQIQIVRSLDKHHCLCIQTLLHRVNHQWFDDLLTLFILIPAERVQLQVRETVHSGVGQSGQGSKRHAEHFEHPGKLLVRLEISSQTSEALILQNGMNIERKKSKVFWKLNLWRNRNLLGLSSVCAEQLYTLLNKRVSHLLHCGCPQSWELLFS